MILRFHVPFYAEILNLPGVIQDPILTFGYQDIDSDAGGQPDPPLQRVRRFLASDDKVRRIARKVRAMTRPFPPIPPGFQYESLSELLRSRGHSVVSLDFFDSRADLRYDMNKPVPESEYAKYATLIDIGCLEHLFDTAQCLENCIRMVRRGGHYLLHTPVNGYFGHGLHVFNPQGLIDGFEDNGFKIVYLKYSTMFGKPVADPSTVPNAILWMVGRKDEDVPVFRCPQQKMWSERYARAVL